MSSIVERLREADKNSVQRMNGSDIFGQAADTIEALAEALRNMRDEIFDPDCECPICTATSAALRRVE